MTTPTLGSATATTINNVTITNKTGTLTLANGSTLSTAGNFTQFGSYDTLLTSTGITNITLPTSGVLLLMLVLLVLNLML